MRISILLFIVLVLPLVPAAGQNSRNAFIDEEGVLRWDTDSTEIFGFGVNYSIPFAHAFRMAKRLGVSHEEAVKQDVYHFARLDLDLYRVHVWDTEISDSVGNLLENEHLRLFDFAVSEMKKRGMCFILTPIAFWGNGWPEPDEDTPGFSDKYGKEACLTHPDAIEAQANYLEQFLNHVNPYTGVAYKDDPDVIAFEVSNEPHHGGSKNEVKAYINKLVGSMRKTGTKKPVFYNMSHSIHLVDAYLEADVQGGTFQWYPSGLVAGHALKGNYLPHVNEYVIPFAEHPEFQNKAKIVYEFDPADVAGNYMYPVMARSFREAGIQLATHFAYDAMFLAPYNTNYGTHFMNLAYAPQKALSLKIASAVFHEIPRNVDFGNFPENNAFGNFCVSYRDDLAELVGQERFFYSNSTSSRPQNPDKLKEIAGFGSSPVVQYTGKGAYFLDEVEPGIWRLEVMPDAYWLKDPYSPMNPDVRKAAVQHALQEMRIALPQLGDAFSVEGINDGNRLSCVAKGGEIKVTPGVYLLKREGVKRKVDPKSLFKNILLDEFVAPATDLDTLLVKNRTPRKVNLGKTVTIDFEVIAPEKPGKVAVFIGEGHFRSRRFDAEETSPGHYTVLLPEGYSQHQTVNYYIAVRQTNGVWSTFPSGQTGKPGDWDFSGDESFALEFLPDDAPLLLWNAEKHFAFSVSNWRDGVQLIPMFNRNVLSYRFAQTEDDSVQNEPLHVLKYFFGENIKGRRENITLKERLGFSAKSAVDKPVKIKLALIDTDGMVMEYEFILNNTDEIYSVKLKDGQPGKMAIVPRPFPGFQGWFTETGNENEFDMAEIEMIQVAIPSPETSQKIDFYLDEIWLE